MKLRGISRLDEKWDEGWKKTHALRNRGTGVIHVVVLE